MTSEKELQNQKDAASQCVEELRNLHLKVAANRSHSTQDSLATLAGTPYCFRTIFRSHSTHVVIVQMVLSPTQSRNQWLITKVSATDLVTTVAGQSGDVLNGILGIPRHQFFPGLAIAIDQIGQVGGITASNVHSQFTDTTI